MAPVDLARLVDYTAVEDGSWYRVGSGNGRVGQVGQQIGVIALRHSPGYEVVMHMQNGRVESFAPHNLFPLRSEAAN